MLNVLILDDQQPNVRAIAALVDWKALLIDRVYQTCSPGKARTFFHSCQIDILLCDIEMPQENGIEFVTWVRQYYPLCECIFITSHADFKYAQTAVALGCLEYILQPVTRDALNKSIRRAVTHIIDSRKMLEYYQNSQYGKILKNNAIQEKWYQLLTNTVRSDREPSMSDNLYSISDANACLPIIVQIKNMNTSLLDFDAEKVRENIAAHFDTFSIYLKTIATIFIDDAHMVLITEGIPQYTHEQQLQGCLQLISEICHDKYGCCLQFYIGTSVFPQRIHKVYRQLMDMIHNQPLNQSGVYYLEPAADNPAKKHPLPACDNWPYIIAAGKIEQVMNLINSYLQEISYKEEHCAFILFPLQRLIDKAFCDSLELRAIPVSILIENTDYQKCYILACQSTDFFRRYLDYLTAFNVSCPVTPQKNEHSVVVEIQNYIDQNIEGDLSRSSIAQHVYLSEDYISHIFKHETGMSLINYINNKKMLLAKKLLSTTSMPVHLVAARVNFTNFSYFTKLFRKTFNITPAEYKKHCHSDNSIIPGK